MLSLSAGFPCAYTTVKCGSSGHNIRVATDLDSTAVGMVVIGNQLSATREVYTLGDFKFCLDLSFKL